MKLFSFFTKLFFKQKNTLPNVTLPFQQEVTRQQKKFFIMFFIFLIFSSVYSYLYIQQKIQEKKLIPVFITTHDIKAPYKLTDADIKEVLYPGNLLPPIFPKNKNDLIGKTLMDSLIQNELILYHNFQRDTDASSIASSDFFKRYYAITAEASWFMSGFPEIKANDTISIMVINPNISIDSSKIVVSNVKVLNIKEGQITLNLPEDAIKQLLFTRSLNLPMQIIVHPNKEENKNSSANAQ